MIKGSILQEDTKILSMYVPNNSASKYMRQELIDLKRRNRYIHYYNWIFQYASVSNW
jgi:hypothetical protein